MKAKPAGLNHVSCREIPINEIFLVDPADYMVVGCSIFLANPNAPTGLVLTRSEIKTIVRGKLKSVVVIDEAYVDFELLAKSPQIVGTGPNGLRTFDLAE